MRKISVDPSGHGEANNDMPGRRWRNGLAVAFVIWWPNWPSRA